MNIFYIVFQSVLALIGIGVLGFWILRRGIIPQNVIGFLSRLAIDIALPCVVFAGTFLNFAPKEFPDWWQLPLWWILFAVVALVITAISMFLSKKETRSEFALSSYFQNGLFFPLIVINGLFGAGSVYIVHLFIFCIFHPVVFFGTSHLFFRKKTDDGNKHKMRLDRLINPVLVATVLAVGIRLAGLEAYIPDFIVQMLNILGGMTLPLIMIILGGSLYIDFLKKGKIYVMEILKFVFIKNIIFPLVFIGLMVLIRPDYNVALIMMLESAVPPITAVPVVAEREGGNVSISNQFILSSFVFSIISIPLMFTLFSTFFPMPN
jgi:predicted permease